MWVRLEIWFVHLLNMQRKRRRLKFWVEDISTVMWVSFKWTLTLRMSGELPTSSNRTDMDWLGKWKMSPIVKKCSFWRNGNGNWNIALQQRDLKRGIWPVEWNITLKWRVFPSHAILTLSTRVIGWGSTLVVQGGFLTLITVESSPVL